MKLFLQLATALAIVYTLVNISGHVAVCSAYKILSA